jgi:predicted enzyme related to lactoylglutathione lyase
MSHGKICYLEIPANAAEASAEFYSSIFGWKVRTRGDGELAFDDPAGVSGTWVKESDRTPDEQTRVYIMVQTARLRESKVQWLQQHGGDGLAERGRADVPVEVVPRDPRTKCG